MKKNNLNPVKVALFFAAFLLVSAFASATTYTAMASGNWSSTATWGGTAPPTTLGANDQVIIGVGLNVTMDNNVTLNGLLAQIDVAGTLSSVSHITLDPISGSITGSGAISATTIILNAAGTIAFNGSITADTVENAIVNLSSAAQMMVNNALDLSGMINLQTGGTLQMGSNSVINISGGVIAVTGGSLNLNSAYSVNYITSSVRTGLELSGTGLTKVNVNVGSGNRVTLAANLNVDTLELTSGDLALNENSLSVNGDLMASYGAILSTPSSNISVTSAASASSTLVFDVMGDTVNNLSVNISGMGSLNLGSSAVINGMLQFMNGYLNLQGNNLTIGASGSIMGAGLTSYVITSGGGNLTMSAMVGDTTMFQVGTSSDYLPAAISLNTGSTSGTIGLNVSQGVYSNGTTGALISASQSMVNATWFFQNNIGSGINANMMLAWTASAEVNGFIHTDDYISHYASMWDDIGDSMSAMFSGSLYSVVRTNVTSMSPFAVFDQATVPTGIYQLTAYSNDFVIYPNPASQSINIATTALPGETVYAEIYNTIGQMVASFQFNSKTISVPVASLASGTYLIKFYNDNMQVVKRFTKI